MRDHGRIKLSHEAPLPFTREDLQAPRLASKIWECTESWIAHLLANDRWHLLYKGKKHLHHKLGQIFIDEFIPLAILADNLHTCVGEFTITPTASQEAPCDAKVSRTGRTNLGFSFVEVTTCESELELAQDRLKAASQQGSTGNTKEETPYFSGSKEFSAAIARICQAIRRKTGKHYPDDTALVVVSSSIPVRSYATALISEIPACLKQGDAQSATDFAKIFVVGGDRRSAVEIPCS